MVKPSYVARWGSLGSSQIAVSNYNLKALLAIFHSNQQHIHPTP